MTFFLGSTDLPLVSISLRVYNVWKRFTAGVVFTQGNNHSKFFRLISEMFLIHGFRKTWVKKLKLFLGVHFLEILQQVGVVDEVLGALGPLGCVSPVVLLSFPVLLILGENDGVGDVAVPDASASRVLLSRLGALVVQPVLLVVLLGSVGQVLAPELLEP